MEKEAREVEFKKYEFLMVQPNMMTIYFQGFFKCQSISFLKVKIYCEGQYLDLDLRDTH